MFVWVLLVCVPLWFWLLFALCCCFLRLQFDCFSAYFGFLCFSARFAGLLLVCAYCRVGLFCLGCLSFAIGVYVVGLILLLT